MFKSAMRASLAAGTAILLSGCMTAAGGDGMTNDTVMVGGAEMLPTRTIVENASNSADHTTLVAAVKAADLVGALSSPGPLTVFAPTNAAFDLLPAGLVETALMPENKELLTNVLTYHVVAGRVTASDLAELIRQGRGSADITTLQGGTLKASMSGDQVVLTDANGRTSTVTQADVMQSNGVVHLTNGVFLPQQ